MLKRLLQFIMICMTAGLVLYGSPAQKGYAPVVFSTINAQNNPIAEMSATKSGVENGQALQKLLQYAQWHGSESKPFKINIPEGRYLMGKKRAYQAIILSSNTHIQLSRQAQLVSEGALSFVGVPSEKQPQGLQNFTWKGGQILGDGEHRRARFVFVKGKNVQFSDARLERVTGFGDHVFDLNAVENYTFDQMQFVGYGHKILPRVKQSRAIHQYQAEAIQLDTNTHTSLTQNDQQTWRKVGGKYYQPGKISGNRYITVQNSQFVPTYQQGKMTSQAQNPIGQHSFDAENPVYSEHITFINNHVTEPVGGPNWRNKKQRNNYGGALHFNAVRHLYIIGNHVQLGKTFHFASFYTNDKLPSSQNISIHRNDIVANHQQPVILLRSSTKEKVNGQLRLSIADNQLQMDKKEKSALLKSDIRVENFHEKSIDVQQ